MKLPVIGEIQGKSFIIGALAVVLLVKFGPRLPVVGGVASNVAQKVS